MLHGNTVILHVRPVGEVINSSQITFYVSRFHLTNPRINTEGGPIAAHTLGLTMNRTVSEGIHEELEIVNYSGKQVKFLLELAPRSDFADIFEVKNKPSPTASWSRLAG